MTLLLTENISVARSSLIPAAGQSWCALLVRHELFWMWLVNIVLGGEGHMRHCIRRNSGKNHGQDSQEDSHPYPFPPIYNTHCPNCYYYKMIYIAGKKKKKFSYSQKAQVPPVYSFFWTFFPLLYSLVSTDSLIYIYIYVYIFCP